jgi:hypothetical protein
MLATTEVLPLVGRNQIDTSLDRKRPSKRQIMTGKFTITLMTEVEHGRLWRS